MESKQGQRHVGDCFGGDRSALTGLGHQVPAAAGRPTCDGRSGTKPAMRSAKSAYSSATCPAVRAPSPRNQRAMLRHISRIANEASAGEPTWKSPVLRPSQMMAHRSFVVAFPLAHPGVLHRDAVEPVDRA